MSEVQRGEIFERTKGVEWNPDRPDTWTTKVDRPVWGNFRFFHRIKTSPIWWTKRVEPTARKAGCWELARTVEFYYRGQLVAVVELVGMKLDQCDLETDTDNSSFWGVSKVGYFRLLDTPRGMSDWREVELEAGLSGRFVRY